MAYAYHDLRIMTIQQLRDIAKDLKHEAVQGYSQMNKEHLLPALCQALAIDAHEHHSATGIDKAAIKARMRELKHARDAALEAHDPKATKALRRQIHGLNRQIRAHLS